MKIIGAPIDALVFFRKGAQPEPYKFKYTNSQGETETVVIQQILEMEEQKIAGIRALVYRCQSIIGAEEKRYELKYMVSECRWELYKM